VNEYNSGKAEHLEALAKSFHVDTAAIRKQVAAEVGAKKDRLVAIARRNRAGSSSIANRALWAARISFGYR